jgi:FkbM family methyltransferase
MKESKIKWLKKRIGLVKSRIIYDYKPFNQRRMKRFYSNFVRQGDLCFDIGAHTGNRTLAWMSMGSKVVTVEPQPLLVKLLEKRFRHYPGFTLVTKAIGSINGRALMQISSTNPAISTLSADWIKVIHDFEPSTSWDDNVTVAVTTLDALIQEYGTPVFCKIDVEGYEEEVLKGLSLPLPALSFEFFPTTPSRAVNCINRLEELGKYKYNWSFTESFKFVCKEWISKEEMSSAILNYRGRKSGDIYAILK